MVLFAKLCGALALVFVVSELCDGRAMSLHASCHLQWEFNLNCGNVSDALMLQARRMSGPCTTEGQKCLYTIVKYDPPMEIALKHRTPVKHYVDDITFTFDAPTDPGNKCVVKGYSTSETWYAVLDYGTNYCNMRNLLTEGKLDKTPGFKQTVGDCTQYSSADCSKY